MNAQAVDVHTHAMPLGLLRWLAGSRRADLSELSTGIVRLDTDISGVGPRAPIPVAATQYDVDARLASMDEIGIAQHVVSLPPFVTAPAVADAGMVTELVRRGNDELSAFCASSDRLLALGTLPVGFPEATAEARRCLDELDCAGVAIGTRGAGKDLDDPVNDELWAFLASRRAFVFLHPNAVPDAARMRDFWLPQLVGYPIETAVAVSRLIFAGVLERFDLTLCVAHGGGCVPALRGRLDLGWQRKDVAHTTSRPPSAHLRELYFDTATFDRELLDDLVRFAGAEHVLLGTDYPFELSDREPLDTVRRADLAAEQAADILGGNFRRLRRRASALDG